MKKSFVAISVIAVLIGWLIYSTNNQVQATSPATSWADSVLSCQFSVSDEISVKHSAWMVVYLNADAIQDLVGVTNNGFMDWVGRHQKTSLPFVVQIRDRQGNLSPIMESGQNLTLQDWEIAFTVPTPLGFCLPDIFELMIYEHGDDEVFYSDRKKIATLTVEDGNVVMFNFLPIANTSDGSVICQRVAEFLIPVRRQTQASAWVDRWLASCDLPCLNFHDWDRVGITIEVRGDWVAYDRVLKAKLVVNDNDGPDIQQRFYSNDFGPIAFSSWWGNKGIFLPITAWGYKTHSAEGYLDHLVPNWPGFE